MAIWVVAAPAEERIRRPCTAAAAGLRIIAAAAKSPEMLDAAAAIELQRRVRRPQLRARRVAHVAGAIALRRERRTALERSVRFQPDRILTRRAAAIIAAVRAAPQHFVRTEVADVVARQQQQTLLAAASMEHIARGDDRVEFQRVEGNRFAAKNRDIAEM